MASYHTSVKRALTASQHDLIDHKEHRSADPEKLATVGRAVGHQLRIKRNDAQFALYTVSQVRQETLEDIVRMGHSGRKRLGTSGEFVATLDSRVPHPTFNDGEAEANSEFVERLNDDGMHTGLIVIAPHGGDIERHTDQQAERVASRLKEAGFAAKKKQYHDAKVVHSYRQLLGATTSKALHDFLAGTGNLALPCRVFTHVDVPNDVSDKYGRMVADIEVTIGGTTTNINQWTVRTGATFPAFYSSMLDAEINTLRAPCAPSRSRRSPRSSACGNTSPRRSAPSISPCSNRRSTRRACSRTMPAPSFFRNCIVGRRTGGAQ